MRNLCLSILLLAGVLVTDAQAGTPTVIQMIGDWRKAVLKDFKKVKAKEAFSTYNDFCDRSFDSIDATGLQSGGTVFSTLDSGLQMALTRLRSDLEDIRDKRGDVSRVVNDLNRDMRTAANSATPPSIESAQKLVYLVYGAIADGEITEKERAALTLAGTAVTSTTGLSTALAADIQSSLNAVLASRGVTKADLELIKTDLAGIATILKAL